MAVTLPLTRESTACVKCSILLSLICYRLLDLSPLSDVDELTRGRIMSAG